MAGFENLQLLGQVQMGKEKSEGVIDFAYTTIRMGLRNWTALPEWSAQPLDFGECVGVQSYILCFLKFSCYVSPILFPIAFLIFLIAPVLFISAYRIALELVFLFKILPGKSENSGRNTANKFMNEFSSLYFPSHDLYLL